MKIAEFARITLAIVLCAFVVFASQFANACDEHESAAVSATAEAPIEIVASGSSCNFDCSSNSENSADMKACLRLQARCEKNATRLPASVGKVGQK